MSNEIRLSDFEFWMINFKNVIGPSVSKVMWFTPIGFSKNESLIVVDTKGKKHWIKKEFWESSSSPYWKINNDSGILVRLKTEQFEPQDLLIAVAKIRMNRNDFNN